MWSTYVTAGLLALILASLARAMTAMLRRNKSPHAVARALTWRIGLSVGLFLLLLLGFATGVLKPHGVQRAAGADVPPPHIQ